MYKKLIEDLRRLANDIESISQAKEPGDASPPEQSHPSDSETAPTTDDLRQAFAKAISDGKKDEAMALVEPLGVSNIREIPLDAIPDLLKKLEAL